MYIQQSPASSGLICQSATSVQSNVVLPLWGSSIRPCDIASKILSAMTSGKPQSKLQDTSTMQQGWTLWNSLWNLVDQTFPYQKLTSFGIWTIWSDMCCEEIVVNDTVLICALQMVAWLPQPLCCYDASLKNFDWKKGNHSLWGAPSTASKLETIKSLFFGHILLASKCFCGFFYWSLEWPGLCVECLVSLGINGAEQVHELGKMLACIHSKNMRSYPVKTWIHCNFPKNLYETSWP